MSRVGYFSLSNKLEEDESRIKMVDDVLKTVCDNIVYIVDDECVSINYRFESINKYREYEIIISRERFFNSSFEETMRYILLIIDESIQKEKIGYNKISEKCMMYVFNEFIRGNKNEG
jgi:hypothetical protein